MRKNKLMKRMCVFSIAVCVTAHILLYPNIPVTAAEGPINIPILEKNVGVEVGYESENYDEVAYGYYDTGYSAPILEAHQYLGLSQNIKLPSSYSSRAKGYVTEVKNQGSLGTCWAFGPIAAMESYALRHGLVDSPADIDLSEYALASFTFDDSTFTSTTGTAANDKTVTSDINKCMLNGGNDQYVFKTLTKWAGIMNELDYPYIWAGTTESVFDASKVSYILTNQYFINMNNTWHVKNAIMENGAVVAHYNADDKYDADLYKNYHYTYNEVGTNHAIAIVGWDDSIAASNFVIVDENGKEQTPAGSGAWLIKNSWGKSYGDGGYMWVSYYDKSIKDTTCAVYQIAPRGQYDYNYQHDGATIMGNNYSFDASVYANVFTVTGNSKQAIKAVSFSIEDASREYSIQIYKNPVQDNPESGIAMLSNPVVGTVLYAGYHTIELPEMLELNDGDTFAIVITFDQITHLTSGYNGDLYVGGGGYATATNISTDNQSYIKQDSVFSDMYEIYGSSYKVNFCIKAMVVDYDNQIEASAITSIEKNGETGFIIGWQAKKNDMVYELLRATELDGDYIVVYSGENTSYVDTSVEKYTKYYYKVRVSDGQLSLDSPVRMAYIGVESTQIKSISSIRSGLKLEWNTVTNVNGYKIYRSLDGVDYKLLSTVSDSVSYIDVNVEYGKKYYYIVKTYVDIKDASGEIIGVEETTDGVVVSAVRDIYAPDYMEACTVNDEYGKICLMWNPAGDVDGYILYRSYFDENEQYIEMEEITYVDGSVHEYIVDVTDIPPGQNIYTYVKSYVNVNSEKYVSDYIYDYVYLDYAPIQNIKWYVNSSGVINVKWDIYSAIGITVTGYTSIVYNDLDGNSIASSVSTTTPSFLRASLDPTKTYYLFVQAKNAMNNSFTPKQNPLVQIGGVWGDFALDYIADVSGKVGEKVTLEAKLKNELQNFDYKYQWYKTSSDEEEGISIEGANSATYTYEVEENGTMYFYCICTGEYEGLKTTKSNVVAVNAEVSDDNTGTEDVLKNGLQKSEDGRWYYYSNGSIDTAFIGLAKNEYGWWYVKAGKLDLTYTGLAKNEYGWWYAKNGKLDLTYTGLAKNEYGWWYVKAGKLDLTYTGLAKNEYGWWYVKAGKLDLTYTGLAKNEFGWWHVKNGKLDLTYTGISKNEYGQWYVKNGKLDLTYTGTIKCNGVTYNIKNGKVVK